MKDADALAKELIENGQLKRMETGMLDVHIEILEKFAVEHKMENTSYWMPY